MSIHQIRVFGDPVLRQRADEVGLVDDGIRKLMKDLIDTMHAAPGVGLAANQIGVLRRVIVWENEEEAGVLADPAIIERKGSEESDEACLSLPGLAYPVARATWVLVAGLDGSGNRIQVEATDLTARILQHEIDHLDGVLFIDHLSDELSRDARRKLMERLLQQPEG